MTDGSGRGSAAMVSVERALDLVELLVEHPAGVRLKELSDRTGLTPSTVHRLLQVLQEQGYARQDDDSKVYRTGMRVIELGARALEGLDLRTVARPHLEWLHRETGETCQLSVPDGDGLVYIDQIRSSTRDLALVVRIGSRGKMHCTASGKVLLASRTREEAESILGATVERYTARTNIEPDQILGELEQVRIQGYALSSEEFTEGISSMAAPVFDYRRRVIACCGIVGLNSRINGPDQVALLSALRQAAAAISTELGFRGGPGPWHSGI